MNKLTKILLEFNFLYKKVHKNSARLHREYGKEAIDLVLEAYKIIKTPKGKIKENIPLDYIFIIMDAGEIAKQTSEKDTRTSPNPEKYSKSVQTIENKISKTELKQFYKKIGEKYNKTKTSG